MNWHEIENTHIGSRMDGNWWLVMSLYSPKGNKTYQVCLLDIVEGKYTQIGQKRSLEEAKQWCEDAPYG